MPGIAGIINLRSDDKGAPHGADIDVEPLMHESSYVARQVPLPNGSQAILIDPGLPAPFTGMASDDTTGATIAFYGEFHDNRFGSAQGDKLAERLLTEYLRRGDDLFHAIEGSFVILLHDPRIPKILMIADRYASRPLFYAEQNGRLYFSPELKSFARLPSFRSQVNHGAWATFLIHGHLLGDQTFYQGVYPLTPGHLLRISSGRAQRVSYSRYHFIGHTPDRGEKYYVDTLADLLRATIAKQSYEVPDTVIAISGGGDSRGIVGCLRELNPAAIRTVTWGPNEDTPSSDALVARRVAEHVNADHRFYRRTPKTFSEDFQEMVVRSDGLVDDPALHHHELAIARKIRSELGAVTLVRGEHSFGVRNEVTSDVEARASVGIFDFDNCQGLNSLFRPSVLPHLREEAAEAIESVVRECESSGFVDRNHHYFLYQKWFHYLARTHYYKHTVLNVRAAWLDNDLISFLATVPAGYRLRKSLYHRTLRQMFPSLMAIPAAAHGQAFEDDWVTAFQENTSLQAYLRHHLFEDRNQLHELVDQAYLENLVSGTFHGANQPRRRQSVGLMKNALRVACPPLYRKIKGAAMRRSRWHEIHPITLTFRLLIAKTWFDLYG